MALPVSLLAQKVADQWRYTLEPPQGAWQTVAYDDAAWKTGNGGFGTVSTPGARVGTVGRTKTIWLRKRVPLAGTLKKPALLVHHDEDAEFFLNGQRVLALKGYLTDYKVVPLAEEHRALVKPERTCWRCSVNRRRADSSSTRIWSMPTRCRPCRRLNARSSAAP